LPDVERLCDHVVMLHQGQLQFAGTLEALTGAHPARYEVRVKDGREALAARLAELGCAAEPFEDRLAVTLPQGGDTAIIFQAVISAGVQLRHMVPMRASLESAFLRAVEESGGGAS
jgi:ABC-type multidrug transport system ATPase subunit